MILEKNEAKTLSRRRLIVGGACLAAMPIAAHAEHNCQPNPFVGGQQCSAFVPTQLFPAIYDDQNQSQWCWAACIAMLFNSYGYRVAQERIVNETFGGLVNMPAGSGAVISQQINRAWRDDSGRRFRSRLVAAYDFDHGAYAIDNNFIIGHLSRNQPLIYGNMSHAMLLVRMDYVPTPMGPNVFGAHVLDPWPGIGARQLQPHELVQVRLGGHYRYLAAVNVAAE